MNECDVEVDWMPLERLNAVDPIEISANPPQAGYWASELRAINEAVQGRLALVFTIREIDGIS